MLYKLSLWFSLILLISGCAQESEYIKPRIRPLTESVYASVQIEPEALYAVNAVKPGLIKQRLINEGDTVVAGDLLFQLKNEQAQVSKDRAALSLEFTLQNRRETSALLTEMETSIQSAQIKLANDSINYFRQKRLWDQGIGSRNTLEQFQLAYQLAQKNEESLKQRYERTLEELDNQFKLANNELKSTRVSDQDNLIMSRINGRVYEVLKELGESVNTQETLARIGSASAFLIVLQIDEADIIRVEKQQKVIITLEAYPNRFFEAVITEIYPNKDLRSQTFRVEAQFVEPPRRLYPGLSGEANIIVSEKPAVLTIPLDYLIDDELVLTKDGEVNVTTGLKSMDAVEILSGIDTSSQLLKPE